MRYHLRLLEDIVPVNADISYLPRAVRAVYVRNGGLTLETATSNQFHSAGSAWVGQDEVNYVVGPEGAEILRWELVPLTETHDGRLRSSPKSASKVLNSFEIDLDPANSWLLRCDQVTFPPGTVAPVHMHQGPGVRWVVKGEIDAIGPGGVAKLHLPGDSFLENGIDEPVSAKMHKDEETSFLRGLILPRSVKGRPSTRFVHKEDWDRPKRQVYHVHAERFFELP
ncbi:hypothetical protein [Pseudochelatococcus sp. G4_1912]|uniref:hypothetical protein n=1 Tax=Pseudochelatococcus sp. G4_1912 TaxID=3114288 RepID=UPI0039C6C9E1